MTDHAAVRMRSSKAYRIFLDELQVCVEKMPLDLETFYSDQEALLEICERFHKIKGGAGFFGLHKLAEIAEKLEAVFKESRQILPDNSQMVMALFRDFAANVKKAPPAER